MSAIASGWVGVLRPRGIWGFVVKRVVLGVITLFVASALIFAVTQVLPGNPARAALGRSATPESVEALSAQLHLERPLVSQYGHWLGDVASGDLGRSFATGRPVTALIGKRIENSAVLVILAALVSVPFSIVLGSVAARRRDGPFDHVTSVGVLALAALPEFVVALGLVVLLATTVVHWLPAVSLIPAEEHAWNHPGELVLPVAALVLAVSPYVTRIMRASMVEVLESDYVEMARLKGLPERAVLWRHAAPNAIAPAIQVVGLCVAYLAGGIVVVEFVFGYPGIGSAFVDAVSHRDLPVVQALSLIVAAVYIVVNICADVATVLVSPRLRTSIR